MTKLKLLAGTTACLAAITMAGCASKTGGSGSASGSTSVSTATSTAESIAPTSSSDTTSSSAPPSSSLPSSSSAAPSTTSSSLTPTPATSSSAPRTSSGGGGLAGESASQIFTQSGQALSAATSVHVAGAIKESNDVIKLDVIATPTAGGGSITTMGTTFKVRVFGPTLYFQAAAAYWQSKGHLPAAQAAKFAGKWIKTKSNGDFASFSSFVSPKGLSTEIFSSSNAANLTKAGPTSFQKQAAYSLKDSDGSNLLVSSTGKPVPLAIISGSSGASGALIFNQYNTAKAPATPPAADILTIPGVSS